MVADDLLICYNFLPLAADHIIDFTKGYYEKHGVTPLHNVESFDPTAVRTGDIIFIKTDYIVNDFFRTRVFDKINLARSFSIITGNSAYQIGRDGGDAYRSILFHPKVEKWYCTNPPEVESDKIVPLPIGFEEPSRMGNNQKVLLDCLENAPPFSADSIFLPFHTPSTNASRQQSIDYLGSLPFVVTQGERQGLPEYLGSMGGHKFVICLEGSGPDTHRNYEALLAGCIPIMKNSTIKKVFELHNLPCVFVDSWQEIDDDFYDKISNSKFDFGNVDSFLRAKTHISLIRGGRDEN